MNLPLFVRLSVLLSVCLSVYQFGGFLGDCFIVFSGFVFA